MIVAAVMAVTISAESSGAVGRLKYEFDETAKTATLCGFAEEGDTIEHLVIPDKVVYQDVEYTVTKIVNARFRGSKIRSVDIPNTIDEIDYSFFDCDSLREVVIPSSVNKLFDSFFWCTSLKKAVLEGDKSASKLYLGGTFNFVDEVYINRGLMRYSGFGSESRVKKLVFGDLVTEITAGFQQCYSLTSVEISNSVRIIRSGAFAGCTNLKSVVMPETLESLEDGAFSECGGLLSITVPEGIDSLKGGTFHKCFKLKSVKLPSTLKSIGEYDFGECSSLPEIRIPASVESIGSSAFAGCVLFENVELPEKLRSLSDDAFARCKALKTIYLPDAVTSIGKRAFSGCTSLTSVRLPSSLESIPEGLFANCTNLASAPIPASVAEIGSSAFMNCACLTEAILPPVLKGLGSSAFSGCIGLTSIVIPDPVETIGASAFQGCTGITEVRFPSALRRVDKNAFNGCCRLTSVDFPELMVAIEEYAFKDCIGISSIAIHDKVIHIGTGAFQDCSSLGTVDLGKSVITISKHAFARCGPIKEIVFPGTVRTIGDEAFLGCTTLKKVVFEDAKAKLSIGCNPSDKQGLFSESKIEEAYVGRTLSYGSTSGNDIYYSYSPFANQKELKKLTFGPYVETIGETEFLNCGLITELVLPGAVTSIENYAFYGCTGIKKVVLEDGTKPLTVGYDTSRKLGIFSSSELEEVYYGRDIKYKETFGISRAPFFEQTTIKKLTIGNDVTMIGDGAFWGCYRLSALVIPPSVMSISKSAFYECSGLGRIVFEDGDSTTTLAIDDIAFSCSLPREVYLGRNLSGTPFANKASINSLTIGGSVTSVAEGAFAGCPEIRSVTFGGVNASGIERAGISHEVPAYVVPKDMDALTGLQHSPLVYFDRLLLLSDGCKYALATAPADLMFENCAFKEHEASFVACGEAGRARIGNSSVEVFYKGKMITGELKSESGFEFVPSEYHAENRFTGYGDRLDDATTRTIHLDKAGTLNEKIGASAAAQIKYLKLSGDIDGGDVYAINDMSALEYLDLSDANIREGGMAYVESLKTRDGVVGSKFFARINPDVILLPKSATVMADSALEGRSSLKYLDLGGVSSIGAGALAGCRELASLTIKDVVTEIGDDAFSGCSTLAEIVVDGSATELRLGRNTSDGSSLFSECCLEKVYMGRNLVSAVSPFSGLATIRELTIGGQVTSIGSDAFAGCTSIKSVVIPESVTEIGSRAFFECRTLEHVELSKSLTQISDGAFARTALTEICLPEGICRIGHIAFADCFSLATVNIPDATTSIGDRAFYGASLTKLRIPAAVTRIGTSAFGGCRKIEAVYAFGKQPPVIESSTFDSDVEERARLHVRKGSLEKYRQDAVWREFLDMADDVLYFEPIPEMTYGDGEIDLSMYAPEGFDIMYGTTDSGVVEISGKRMRIVGAGETTLGAMFVSDEANRMEIVGKMRKIKVHKANLVVTVADIIVEQGQPLPEFSYVVEGLVNGDTTDDIEELPKPVCDVDENTLPGEYLVTFTGGYDRNYAIVTKNAKVTVANSSAIHLPDSDSADGIVTVYTPGGQLIYKGPRADAMLTRGNYIVRQGNKAYKITVR